MHKKKSHSYTVNDWQRARIEEFRQRSQAKGPFVYRRRDVNGRAIQRLGSDSKVNRQRSIKRLRTASPLARDSPKERNIMQRPSRRGRIHSRRRLNG